MEHFYIAFGFGLGFACGATFVFLWLQQWVEDNEEK